MPLPARELFRRCGIYAVTGRQTLVSDLDAVLYASKGIGAARRSTPLFSHQARNIVMAAMCSEVLTRAPVSFFADAKRAAGRSAATTLGPQCRRTSPTRFARGSGTSQCGELKCIKCRRRIPSLDTRSIFRCLMEHPASPVQYRSPRRREMKLKRCIARTPIR
jgi:hypothetical protein